MVDGVAWVQVLNPTLEQKNIYENEKISYAENIENISRIQQNNPDNKTNYRKIFYFETHVNASSMSFSCDGMTKVRSLFTKHEIIF